MKGETGKVYFASNDLSQSFDCWRKLLKMGLHIFLLSNTSLCFQ